MIVAVITHFLNDLFSEGKAVTAATRALVKLEGLRCAA